MSVTNRIDGRGGKMYVPRAAYSLRMSFWIVPPSDAGSTPRSSATMLVHQQEQRGRGVDRHRGGDGALIDAVEEPAHVVDRRDRDTDAPDFAPGALVVRVESKLRRQVEGDAQPGRAALEQEPVAGVALLDRGEPGVLAHRPAPAAIHRRIDARV